MTNDNPKNSSWLMDKILETKDKMENELIYQVKNSFVEEHGGLEEDINVQFNLYPDGLYVIMPEGQVEIDLKTTIELVKLLNHRYGQYIK